MLKSVKKSLRLALSEPPWRAVGAPAAGNTASAAVCPTLNAGDISGIG